MEGGRVIRLELQDPAVQRLGFRKPASLVQPKSLAHKRVEFAAGSTAASLCSFAPSHCPVDGEPARFCQTCRDLSHRPSRCKHGRWRAAERQTPLTALVFDALTADRPYRAAMPVSRALAILWEGAGASHDPVCIAALERALTRADMAAA